MQAFRQDQIDRDFDIIAEKLRTPASTTQWAQDAPVPMWTLRIVATIGFAIAALLVLSIYSLAPIAGWAVGLLSPAVPLAMVVFAERHQSSRLI